MKTKVPFNQKLHLLSPFQYFMWLFCAAFGMICFEFQVYGAEAEGSLYSAKGKRDPFVQLVGTGAKASAGGLLSVESVEEISIEGIVVDTDPKQSIVVVNGSVLKEGDEVGSVKVLKIRPDGASFSVNGIEAFKPLYQEEVKK